MLGQSVLSIAICDLSCKCREERKPLLGTFDISIEEEQSDLYAMWTVLVILCLTASFDVDAARRLLNAETALGRSDSTVSGLRTVEDIPVRLARKFRGNSRTRRLHIENQHGFDGKVEKIHINSEEDLPGIRAYGMPKKDLTNNGHIERTIEKDVEVPPRVARSVQAYGKTKEHLEMNGHIERGHAAKPPSNEQHLRNPEIRVTRSIETNAKQDDLADDQEDLEAQDSKVFRPLFVYRQQTARKQHRTRNQIHGFPSGLKSCHDRRPVF